MTKPTREINDFVSVLRILLTRGLIDKNELVAWADNEINNADSPDEFVIEFSMIGTKSTNQIFELLDNLSDNSKSLTSGRALIGLIANKINERVIDYKRGFEILYSVQREFDLTQTEKNYINHADDELELAINKIWGDKDDVQERTKTFLNCYQGFTLDNVDDWKIISEQVDKKLKLWDKKLV